ncbi:MAG TPA: hypothetical protein VFV39_02480 [Limnobacter sp.]|nr:hypothetical protein [Limnobacter sp.]
MQTIELSATAPYEHFPSDVVELQAMHCVDAEHTDLDDALARLVQAVRQSGLDDGMEALGTLLAYMETLEKNQARQTANDAWITLSNPLTMSV